ncbi:MAG TPA: type VII secretion protein EccE [Actinocrinis sp.]|nr:type VII secretion protein EccE [Actinocrinis sp.]
MSYTANTQHRQAAPGAAAPGRRTVSARAGFQPRPGRIGPVPLIRVIFLEAAAALVVAPVLTHKPALLIGTAPFAVLSLIGAVGGGRGRWLGQLSLVRGDFRERREARPGPPGGEAALAPLRETYPGLRTSTLSSRTGEPVGMIGDGTFLTAVVRVSARQEPLRAPRRTAPLPLGAVTSVLNDPQLPAACVQIVSHTLPAPTQQLPPQAMATRSYQTLAEDVPAQRTTWVAVRLDPEECASAIESRGGGSLGAQRSLLTLVQRVASEIEGSGFETVLLSEPELITALGTACAVNPVVGTTPGTGTAARRTAEARRTWRCDDRWHTTYWVDRLPDLATDTSPDLVAGLTGLPTLSTTLAVTATRGIGDAVGFSMHVRVSARAETQLAEATRALEQQADKLGAGLTRLDGEQLPGLIATIPLGGQP